MSERHPTDTPSDEEHGFLSRWSRRKRGVAAADGAEVDKAELQSAEPEPPPLTDADMPPIDSLDEQSDYSGFLSPGVSEELRQLALRKLFRSAAFNVTDGLDDYAEDFTSFQALGDIVTREMRVREALDAAREKARAALAEDGAPAVEAADDPCANAAEQTLADDQPKASPAEEPSDEQPTQSA